MHGRVLITGLLCALISAAFVLPVLAAEDEKQAVGKDVKDAKPSATLDVASEEMRLIMGGTAGKGVLHFNGKNYPFVFKNTSGTPGGKMVKKMIATGNVYFLNRIEDFAGQYSYTSTTQTIMAGSTTTTATYKNGKGVSINLGGTVEGMGLSVGGGIATVALVKQ